MKKVILVEGKDDKAFIEALVSGVETKEIIVDELKGLNRLELTRRLKLIKDNLQKDPIEKLGIILDLDEYSETERLSFINDCLNEVFAEKIDKISEFKNIIISGIELQIICYFVNPNLDILLRQIAQNQAIKADCLTNCLENDATILQKEKDKAWVFYHIRWDISNSDDRKHGNERISIQYSIESKNAWKLDSPLLNDLKSFLEKFS